MLEKKDKKIKKQLQELQDKCEENMAGWQRAKADYENLKKETDKKISELSGYVKAGLLTELIPIIDNFSKAIEHVPEDQKEKDWVVGVFHIKKQLEGLLDQNGLVKIDTVGQDFDPNLHEAVGYETGEKDKVIKEVSSGYKLNGQVVVPAKVIIGK